jgi:phi13 family phage major tail protein
MTANYKSFVGVSKVYFALITDDSAAAYAAGIPAYLAPVMNVVQTPKTNSKVQYADDQPFDAMQSEGETELDVEITGLPLDIQAVLLGKVYDPATGRLFDSGGTAPYVALAFRSKKSDSKYRYYWFLKGTFSTPSEEMATKTDTPDPKSVKLKFTAIRTIHEFTLSASVTDSVKRVVGDTNDPNFNESPWFEAVQVPSYGAPSALTCTPSPADGAGSVAITTNITLTFNNALAGNVENGIILTTDAGVVKACARTIDEARKVVTLNPTTDLETSTTYLVIVPGIVDVFGQALADTVYDFTTAS